MSRKNECKIVQDLLPNYVEGLTNEETNLFIEEHLRECNTCKKMFNNMKTEIQKPDKEVNKNEVNYIKKYNIKLKTLKIIIIIILIIFITILGRKTIILLSLSEKAKENQSYDNYYIKLNSYQGDYFITTEIYNKGEDSRWILDYKSKNLGNNKKFLKKNWLLKYLFQDKQFLTGKQIKVVQMLKV
jgi:hypothetical protein